MPVSGYYVTLQTRDPVKTAEYAQTAGQLTNAIQATLGDPHKLREVLHCPEITDPRVEVEVAQSEPESTHCPVVARCVVQADAPKKLSFDKNLFTAMVRGQDLPFNVTITKRMVAKDEYPEQPTGEEYPGA